MRLIKINAIRVNQKLATQRPSENIRRTAIVFMARVIWRAMYGNGARIGGMKIITRLRRVKIRKVLLPEVPACFVVVRSIMKRPMSAVRGVTGSMRITSTGSTVFAWWMLPFDSELWSLWTLGLWRRCPLWGEFEGGYVPPSRILGWGGSCQRMRKRINGCSALPIRLSVLLIR